MFRIKSVSTLAALAFALIVAPLAHAQGTTTSGTTPAAQSTPAAKAPAKSHMSKASAMPKVDMNSATREQLMSLPGIGEAIADKIIAARPFKAKSELLSKGLVTKAQYAKLASHIIAKQEPAGK